VREPHEDGRVPEREFEWRCKSTSRVREPHEDGRVPEREFESRCK